MVALDASGRVVRPAKLWNDTESAPDADWLVDQLERCAGVGRRRAAACRWPPSRSRSCRGCIAASPVVWPRLRRVLLPHDYLNYRLTGDCVHRSRRRVGHRLLVAPRGRLPVRPPGDRRRGSRLERGGAARWSAPRGPCGRDTRRRPTRSDCGPRRSSRRARATTWPPRSASACDRATSRCRSARRAPCSPSTRPRRPTPRGAVAGFADATGRFLPLVCTLNATLVTETFAGLLGVIARAARRARRWPARPAPTAWCSCPTSPANARPTGPTPPGSLSGLRVRHDARATRPCRVRGRGLWPARRPRRARRRHAEHRTTNGLFLVGGGARPAAYRQIVADLAQREVTVPAGTNTWPSAPASRPRACCTMRTRARLCAELATRQRLASSHRTDTSTTRRSERRTPPHGGENG